MFRLSDPPVIVTQHEHARFAGMLAAHWGNERLDPPAINRASFIAGVSLHDWHYGLIDVYPLDDLEPPTPDRSATWLQIARLGCEMTLDDPVAEAIAKRHLLRLIGDDQDPQALEMRDQLEIALGELCQEGRISRADLDWQDRITALCDRLAYDLFRTPKPESSGEVYRQVGSAEQVRIHYAIEIGSRISMDPWPFDSPSLRHTMLTYARDGYPESLRPHTLEIAVEPMAGA